MNSVEWNPKYNLLAYAGDDKNKYQADDGMVVAVTHFSAVEWNKTHNFSWTSCSIVSEKPQARYNIPNNGIFAIIFSVKNIHLW